MKYANFLIAAMALVCSRETSHGQQPGEMIWSFTTGGAIISSPAVASDGTIYVGSGDRKLYAVNPDGTLQWAFTAGSAVESSPLIGPDGTIYVGSRDNKLYAINPDGTKRWEYATGNDVSSSPAIARDGTVYVGSLDRHLHAIDPEGFLLWKFNAQAEIEASPAVTFDGTICVGAGTNFFGIDQDGTERWVFSGFKTFDSSAAIANDGTIYVGCRDNKLYALTSTGTKIWEATTSDDIVASPSIDPDGIVYVGSNDRRLYAIRPNSFERWSVKTGGAVHSSAAIGEDGTIYVGSNDEKLYSFTRNGAIDWTFSTGGEVRSSPAIGADGTLYVGSKDGKLYAIKSSSRLAESAWPMFRRDVKHRGNLESTNRPPLLNTIADQTVTEGQPLQVRVTASDPDGSSLTFTLDPDAPSGATIITTNGIFSWTPTEAQGPGNYNITARVTDKGSPSLSDFRVVKVTVSEVNSAPVLAPISNLVVDAHTLISFKVLATDPDLPTNSLTFSLSGDAPAGTAIHPSNGEFTWQPGDDRVGTTNSITVRVNDDGSPGLSDAKDFSISVVARLASIVFKPNGGVSLSWPAVAGTTYRVQYKTNLTDALWNDLGGPRTANSNTLSVDDTIGSASQRFYRILTP